MKRYIQSLIVALCGTATSFVTAAILVFIELRFGWALYSFSLWFVIPAGAVCAGFVAASGYYFGSRLINFRPSRNLLAAIVAVSVGTFFLIYWLEYIFLTADGQAISSVISYSQFLNYSVSHTSLRLGYRGHPIGKAVDIGSSAGYFYAALQIIGFAFGGLATYAYLRSESYCEDCKLYLIGKGEQTRYFDKPEDLQASRIGVLVWVEGDQYQKALQSHADAGSDLIKDKLFSSTVELRRCKGCETHWLKYRAQRKGKDDWKDISELSFAGFFAERVEIAKRVNP